GPVVLEGSERLVISRGGTRHGESSRYPKSSQQQTGTGESGFHPPRPHQDGTDDERRRADHEGRLNPSGQRQRWRRQLRARKESATRTGFRGPAADTAAVAGASIVRPGVAVRHTAVGCTHHLDISCK